KIGFREIGFFRRGLGAPQFHVGFLQRLGIALAFGDVARGGKNALQRAVPVVESGGVVRHLGSLAVPGAGRQLVVGNFLFAEYQLDGGFGTFWVRKVVLERRADQLVARAAGERLHLPVDIGDDAARIGGHGGIDVGFDQRARVKLLVAQALIQFFLFLFHL